MAKQMEAHLQEEYKIWSFVVLCQKQIKNARRKNRERKENSSCRTHFEHFLESILYILYIFSKLRKSRVQRFKRCVNQSLNEEVMAIGRQSHQVEGQFRKLRNHKVQAAKSTFSCEMDTFRLQNFCRSCYKLRNPLVCSQIFATNSFRFFLQIFVA